MEKIYDCNYCLSLSQVTTELHYAMIKVPCRFFETKNLPRIVTGSVAALMSLFFLISAWPQPKIVIASCYFTIACIIDTLSSKIPNILNASLVLVGLALFFYNDGWVGVFSGLTGILLGLALLILPWLMGGMGAGDVKALAALGALLGPTPLLHVFAYMALFGGILAIMHYLVERNIRRKAAEWFESFKSTILTNDPSLAVPEKTELLRFPYAAAIAFGYYTYLLFGEVYK